MKLDSNIIQYTCHATHRYLNSQHIQKQKFSDADLTYGSMQMDVSEQLLEIGELPGWVINGSISPVFRVF